MLPPLLVADRRGRLGPSSRPLDVLDPDDLGIMPHARQRGEAFAVGTTCL
jgi:hypothetical protein